MSFADFVQLALYHPEVGYYAQPRPRVGYGPGTDFYTSSVSGPVFGELVAAAAIKLLGPRSAAEHTFVEIGAETDGGVLQDVPHPFKAVRVLRFGAALELSGPCVVFSNELFDAQPFRRFRFAGEAWQEIGVRVDGGVLSETPLRGITPPVPQLPVTAAEGYVLDAPIAAATLAAIIARQPWTGLFLALDYGKSWQELVEACPAGTARAYYQHTQLNALLERPGEQDLTCHVCWDWISDALQRHGFGAPELASQESFFIRHADAYLAPAIAADAGQLTARKRSLLQLLHGAHLGQKFQALHALR